CCRYKNEETKDLNVRDWTCPKCHSNHDRDVNASINILMQGILAN
ncbi:zinc ribbon domain-containing protein, partial [Holdemanella porci]